MTTMTGRSGEIEDAHSHRSRFGVWAGLALFTAVVGSVIAADAVAPMIVKPYETVRFAPLDIMRPDGAEIAVLSGNPASGPSAMFLKIRRGVGAPHVHTSDYHLLVVEGEMQHWGQGQAEADAPPLRAGSYWFQPGNVAHTDACLTDRCIVFVQWSGPRDARIATPAK